MPLDLTVPALRRLSGAQSDEFRRLVTALIAAGGVLTPFEFLLRHILGVALTDAAAPTGRPRQAYFAIKPLLPDVEAILTVLARADGKDETAVAVAFVTGAARIETDRPLSPGTVWCRRRRPSCFAPLSRRWTARFRRF